ncbi:hypothetical protein KC19_VG151300 [Ceratodon purpureus]|uniref:PUB 62/63 C-terminal domain-containing protein n=1 Tax=Ceratodon purpureus TaxID=3225 RepID=A0A8T0HQ93_CERPU|nr:hypothetical protein KC19_VG151300 [Ceratodon purpureus]
MASPDADHVMPDGYEPIPVQFSLNSNPINTSAATTLRSALSDPLTGALLQDAMASFCGHSYGGRTLQRVYDTLQCPTCGATVERSSMVHNLALRAAAAVFKRDERMRQSHSESLRLTKRKRDGEQVEMTELRKPEKEFPKSSEKNVSPRPGIQGKGVQFPFSVNEKVLIKGNKRTPMKFVGREACITTQCLNGWYLVRLLESGESVRLQYRSLARSAGDHIAVGDNAWVSADQ